MSFADLMQAAQDALFAALKPLEDDASLPAGVQVYQHVPTLGAGQKPPLAMVVIGAIDSENADTKGEQLEKITAEVHAVYRGPGRAPLLALMHAARLALDRQEISLAGSGVLFEFPHFIKAAAGDALADNTTYVGLMSFEFHAWPG